MSRDAPASRIARSQTQNKSSSIRADDGLEMASTISNAPACRGGLAAQQPSFTAFSPTSVSTRVSPVTLLLDRPALIWLILEYMPLHCFGRVFRISKRFYRLATHNNLWKTIVPRTHLAPLVSYQGFYNCSSSALGPNLSMEGLGGTGSSTTDSPAPGSELFTSFVADAISLRALIGQYCFTAEDATDRAFTFSSVKVLVARANLGFVVPVVRVRLHLTSVATNQQEWYDGVLRVDAVRSQLVLCTWTEGYRWIQRLPGPEFDVLVTHVQRGWANQSKAEAERHQSGLRMIFTVRSLPKKSDQLPWSSLGPHDIIAVSRPNKKRAITYHYSDGGLDERGSKKGSAGRMSGWGRIGINRLSKKKK